jgi:hypothetical protein
MRYSFTADSKEGYLHIRVQGENTPATARRYIKDILAACTAEGCPNVLVEEALVGPRLGIGDIFAIISEKSAAVRPVIRLMAFVDVNATNPANMKFGEDVAVNRGVTVRVFDTVPEAEKWLRKQLAPPKP